MSSVAPPAGRYGPPPRPVGRRAATAAAVAVVAVAVAVAAWFAASSSRTGVTWQDVGFTLGDGTVEVVYDVVRRDPSVPVECRLEALNQAHAQVGALTVQIPPGTDQVERWRSTVAVAEPAVTGIVDVCEAA